jgi:hypothetical protein
LPPSCEMLSAVRLPPPTKRTSTAAGITPEDNSDRDRNATALFTAPEVYGDTEPRAMGDSRGREGVTGA